MARHQQDLREQHGPGEQRRAHSKISINRRSQLSLMMRTQASSSIRSSTCSSMVLPRGVVLHPERAGRGGDDAGQRGQTVGVAHIERDAHEPGRGVRVPAAAG